MDFLNIIVNNNHIRLFINGIELKKHLNITSLNFDLDTILSVLFDLGENHKITDSIYIETDVKDMIIIWKIKNRYSKKKQIFKFNYNQYRFQLKKLQYIYATL